MVIPHFSVSFELKISTLVSFEREYHSKVDSGFETSFQKLQKLVKISIFCETQDQIKSEEKNMGQKRKRAMRYSTQRPMKKTSTRDKLLVERSLKEERLRFKR